MVVKTAPVRGKSEPVEVRLMTLPEAKGLRSGQRVAILDKQGFLRHVTVNGAVRLWKRDPDRVEISVKYGLYEHGVAETIIKLDANGCEVKYLGIKGTICKLLVEL